MAIVFLECECARRGFPFAGRALLGSKRLFLCPCGYSTNRKWVLQRHQATRHPNMRRQQLRACSNCGTNLTIDTGWGTYRCPQCSAEYKETENTSGERIHKCHLCKMTYVRRKYLDKHLETHF